MFRNLSTDAVGLSGRQSEVIELALSYKFKGIELDVREFQGQVQSGGLPFARRLLDSARLNIGYFRLPFAIDADEATYRPGLAELSELAGLASQLGCTRTIARIAPASEEKPYHENFEFQRRRLIEIAGVLAPLNIRLGLEYVATAEARSGRNFQFIHSLDALVMLAGMTGQKNVGIVLDLFSMHVSGSSIDEARKLSTPQVVAVFVSDAAAGDAGTTLEGRLLPGETGVIDAAAALTKLAEMGYDGPVTPAAHSKNFTGMSRNAIVKQAGEKLDAVWKGAGLNPAGKLVTPAGKK